MTEIDDAQLARLLQDLRSDDWKVATQAQHTLAHGGSRVVAPLCLLLEAEPVVAWRATWVLGRLKDQRSVLFLVRRANQLLAQPAAPSNHREDHGTLLLAELVEALGLLKSTEGVSTLCAALASSHYGVRKQASRALERVGKAAVPTLCASLDGLPAEGLLVVAPILAKYGDARAIGPLCAVLDHDDTQVKLRATQTLGALAPRYPVLALRAAIPHLERNQRGWTWGQEALRLASKRTLKQVEAATAHLQDVPLPASTPPPDRKLLPLPAGTLSLADPEGAEPPGELPEHSPLSSWRARLRRWLRREMP